jgi:anti-sigma-K factor RskA
LYDGYDSNSFMVVTYNLPALPSGKTYQLWLIDPNGNRTSGGTFTVDSAGSGWLMGRSPVPLNQYKAVGVTVEPWGGSPGPTGAKMLGGNL